MVSLQVLGEESAGQLARRLIVAADSMPLLLTEATAGIGRSVRTALPPAVRGEAPVQSGALERGLSVTVTQGVLGLVVSMESSAPYTDFVVHGTGVYHRPEPHQSWDEVGFQHFTADGRDIYTQHTHHEGQRPNDFVERGLDKAAAPIRAALVMAAEQVWVRFERAV